MALSPGVWDLKPVLASKSTFSGVGAHRPISRPQHWSSFLSSLSPGGAPGLLRWGQERSTAVLEPRSLALLPRKGSWGSQQAEGTVTRAQREVSISPSWMHAGLGRFKLEMLLLASPSSGFLNHAPVDTLG